tara:strand:- start:379 stop:567 length:189 start_codon:yes stop_codon:yes gene_type:complete
MMNHKIEQSISHTVWFASQKEMAEWLGITNGSKKAIAAYCKKYGYGCQFDEYHGEYNIERAK